MGINQEFIFCVKAMTLFMLVRASCLRPELGSTRKTKEKILIGFIYCLYQNQN